MMHSLLKLAGRPRSARTRRAASRPARSVRPSVLALEDRVVPAAPTEMADLARLFPRHAGPTMLFLNFDGWQDRGIDPFMSVTGPADRDKDIQDVLFRTAELFAPFDVQVLRRTGDGSHATDGGATTIFIGDDSDNGTGTANRARAFTESHNVDFPGNWRGITHRLNSDSYNVAYVDPVEFTPMPTPNGNLQARTALQISRSIAHEAGHTFGLAHVRTDGQTDPAPLTSQPVPDLMSYPTAAGEIFFADQSFPITEANFTSSGLVFTEDVVPKWHTGIGPFIFPYRMQTQNSFATLQAALGARPGDDFANVAHPQTVAHFVNTAPVVTRGSLLTGTIQRSGDYDVFQFTAGPSENHQLVPGLGQTVNVSTLRVPGGVPVNTTVQVYKGETLVAFNNNRTATDVYSQVTFTAQPGETFRIVVGAAGGVGAGHYRLWVSAPGDPNPDQTGPRVVDTFVNYNIKTGRPMSIQVTFNEDVDPASFSPADVALVAADGTVRRPSSVTPVNFLNRQFVFHIGLVPPGDYTLRIGPNVTDFAGNRMNQDGDAVNGETSQDVYTEFVALEPLDLDLETIESPRGRNLPL
jgi:hypothetical protein